MNSLKLFKQNLNYIKEFKNVERLLKNNKFNMTDIHLFQKKHIDEKYYLRDYNKHLLFKNNLLDCYLIFWNKKAKSKIHDHSENGCYYKILKGSMCEYIYDENLDIVSLTNLLENDINYIDNNKGYHKMINDNDYSISIHVYSPPDYIMNVYD